MSVARIIPFPIPSMLSRKPRPDDPTPRRPPAGFSHERKKDPPLKRRRTDSMDSFDEMLYHGDGPSAIGLKTRLPPPAMAGKFLVSNAKGKGKVNAAIDLHEDDESKQSQSSEMEILNKTVGRDYLHFSIEVI